MAKPARAGDAKPQNLALRLAGPPRQAVESWPTWWMEVEGVQHYPGYQSSPVGQHKAKDRTSALVIGSILVFMFLGFLAGLVLLAIRNAYLFT
jgi:hypothetical protein